MSSNEADLATSDDARANAPGQLTGAVVIVALVSAVSGMLYGYDTGIISGALLQITKDFGIAEAWKQVIAASILLGAVIGALTCSYLSEKRGRKGTLVMLAVVFVVGALWCAFSPNPVLLSLGTARPRLRGRRRDADRTHVRRRTGSAEVPGPARALLPDRHRRRHRDRDDRRGVGVDPVAVVDRRCRRARRDHARSAAAVAGEPAVAGQARRPRQGARGPGSGPPVRLRRRRTSSTRWPS